LLAKIVLAQLQNAQPPFQNANFGVVLIPDRHQRAKMHSARAAIIVVGIGRSTKSGIRRSTALS
jgi:hypothetical protein